METNAKLGHTAKELLGRMLPRQIDNQYQGALIVVLLWIPLTGVTLWRSLHHLLAADGGAQSIATIPLDSFSADGSAAVVGAFSLWGLSQLIIGLIYLAAITRYRRLMPLLCLLLILEYLIRYLIGVYKPIPLEGTAPGGVVNIPAVIVGAILLALALRRVNPQWPLLRRTLGF